MSNVHRRRRVIAILVIAIVPAFLLIQHFFLQPKVKTDDTVINTTTQESSTEPLALAELESLDIKDWFNQIKYERKEFGNGWSGWNKCDTRQRILARDLTDIVLDTDDCTVLSGTLDDPYTGNVIEFTRGVSTSSAVQIDHVVALSNAWQTGANYLDRDTRVALANDDLELIAVEGKANQQKSNSDASKWLPSNIAFRCQYVARQIAVKIKYELWITQPEYEAIKKVLTTCPEQRLPSP